MSKVNCEAVGKRRQASLRMARAELLQFIRMQLQSCYIRGEEGTLSNQNHCQ